MAQQKFISGVIEGFYGKPWSPSERLELFESMAAWGLNTYLYGPKDDLKHRALWRELYSGAEAAQLKEATDACHARGISFVYGIGPGLDISYSSPADLRLLKARVEQMAQLGCDGVAVLFDDIPDRMRSEDARRFGSFASAQAFIANEVEAEFSGKTFFCPTPYCGRMAARKLGGENYLEIIGRELAPEIDVFWTGPEIISETITVAHVREVAAKLRRKPVIWDNLHANDYDGRRFFCGPYSGREHGILNEVNGILSNPNCEFTLNYVPLRTMAWFASGEQFDPRQAYLGAISEWRVKFETVRGAAESQDVAHLGDCFYLPFQDGDMAAALWHAAREAINGREPAEYFLRDAARLREFCARLADLKDRNLFYALSRRIWELREELDLLEKFVAFRANPKNDGAPFRSDFHLPKTYRGGFVAQLQQLLKPQSDGHFEPAAQEPGVCAFRDARPEDLSAAYYICMKTGDFGKDGEPFFAEDPGALGRIFVGPYLAFEPELSLILEDGEGVCGYAFGAFDSRRFFERYEKEWRPKLVAEFPEASGDPAQWTRVQTVHGWYHHPDYFMPEPYEKYPSHLHIDLLPRAQGRGFGRRMLDEVMRRLKERGSPGAHLGVSALNTTAFGFYERLGFKELIRVGEGSDAVIYMGKTF